MKLPRKFIFTRAVRHAMLATNDQKVFRISGPNGKVWKCERKGVSPRTLWVLLANDLIEDEPQTAVTASELTTTRMRLSRAGLGMLVTKVRDQL